MASPTKQFLTADEIEADPAIVRHRDALQKTRNRSGQKGGASKLTIEGTFAPRLIEMMESPAYRAMSLSCHRLISRLEIEFENTHHRSPLKNGEIVCTTDDFAEYGINRNQIAPARREAVALGLVRVTRDGAAGNADHRHPALYLLTYRHAGSDARLEDGWRRIKTTAEARAIAKAAREGKPDPRAREFGKRGAKARWAKAAAAQYGFRTERADEGDFPSHGNRTELGMETVLKPSHGNRTEGPILSSTETVPLSRVSQGGCGGSIRIHEAHAATQPARLPWPAPRFRELDPVTEDPIGSWSPLLSNAPAAGSAQLTVDVLTQSAFSTAHVH